MAKKIPRLLERGTSTFELFGATEFGANVFGANELEQLNFEQMCLEQVSLEQMDAYAFLYLMQSQEYSLEFCFAMHYRLKTHIRNNFYVFQRQK